MSCFTRRCCGCNLVAGGMTLGWIGLIADFIYFILIVASLILHEAFWKFTREDFENKSHRYHLSKMEKKEVSTFDFKTTLGRVILGVMMCIVMLLFASDFMLLRGAIRKRAPFILPYIIIEPACILFYIGLCIMEDNLTIILILTALIVIRIYFWICMVSLFLKLRESADEPQAYGNYNVDENLNNSPTVEMGEIP